MRKPSQIFAERLNAYLRSGKKTKSALAEETGISRVSFDRYISGETVPGLDQAQRIAMAIGTTLTYMIDDGTPPTPPEPTTAQAFERVRAALADLNTKAEY